MRSFGEDVLVPLAAVFFLFGLPVLAFIFFRLMRHRERMAMIRSGLTPDLPFDKRDFKDWRSARSGRSAGFASNGEGAEAAQVTLRKGIAVTFVGFAITLGLSFVGYDDGNWRPGPWLLGGLIPMFVGLAQVCIAVLSGASLRPANGPNDARHEQSPTAPPPPPAGSPPIYDTSYTYRPDETQELRPPRPPERRP